MKHSFLLVTVCAAAAMMTLGALDTRAQSSGRQGAMFDITGQWVAVVNEDWRWRMVTPPKGDTSSVPLNPSGRRVASSWDLVSDRAQGRLCKAFGGPGLIRQPGRIRIRWDNDNTLVMEFDAGMQTRRLYFGAPPAPGARSLQGYSIANWFKQPQNRGIFGRGGAQQRGSLEVVTNNLEAGYLRPNGVPYSERTVMKEFFDTFTLPEDGSWLIITTVVNDPEYLTQEFVLSTQFKKESDLSKWSPRQCEIPDPPPAQGTP